MGRRAIALLAVAAIVVAAAAAWSSRGRNNAGPAAVESGNRRGLTLRTALSATRHFLVLETRVANKRGKRIRLVPDQCGRITEVVLARTQFDPKGRTWTGSLQAVKRFILNEQRLRQDPDRFQPRRPGETSSKPPPCERPARPVTLAPGQTIRERWELPFSSAYAFEVVGSAHTVVRSEVVEARRGDEPEFLDMLITGEAEDARRGRNLKVEQPTSLVVRRPARAKKQPSLGQLYDRLLANKTLRDWIAARRADSWRDANLLVTPDELRFRAVTTQYERAVVATARPDATGIETRVPGEADRARIWKRRPATLPPGIALANGRQRWTVTEDVYPASVRLPSGRIVVGEYLLDAQPLDMRVRPGVYPVHATLARYRKNRFDDVALATLVLSDRTTVRWREATVIAVDGGTATITSAEAAAALRRLFDRDQKRWTDVSDEMFDSLVAHDSEVTEFTVAGNRNLSMFTSGLGDGGYPVFVGLDRAGRPTRVVIDFLLLHLKWP
jgi:hypothetical protein